jgi:hypothetical protein
MVAASSYQNDGRAAPTRLTAAASTATSTGSTTRRLASPLNTPSCFQTRWASLFRDYVVMIS